MGKRGCMPCGLDGEQSETKYSEESYMWGLKGEWEEGKGGVEEVHMISWVVTNINSLCWMKMKMNRDDEFDIRRAKCEQ